MVYIKRDETGSVVALSSTQPCDADDARWQRVDSDGLEVQSFLGKMAGGQPATSPKAAIHSVYPVPNQAAGSMCALGVDDTDIALIRVIEDLIDTLIKRGLIRFTDLPIAAQNKLIERRSWRSSMRETQLLDDDENVI